MTSITATTPNPPTEWRCAALQQTQTSRIPNAVPQALSAITMTLPQMNSGGPVLNTSTITPARMVYEDSPRTLSTLTTSAAHVRWLLVPKSQWGPAGWHAHLKTGGVKTISWTCSRLVQGSTILLNACGTGQIQWDYSPKATFNHSLTLAFTISTRIFSSRVPPQLLRSIFRATSQTSLVKSTGAWTNKLATTKSKKTLRSLADRKKKQDWTWK